LWQLSSKGKLLLRRNKYEDINLSKLYIKVSSNLTENKTFPSYKGLSTNTSFQNNSQSTNVCKLISITNLMHNSFILIPYVCYITILDMVRALTCPSSGGQIVLSQNLVSSLSVNSCTVSRKRADCSAVCSLPAYCTQHNGDVAT